MTRRATSLRIASPGWISWHQNNNNSSVRPAAERPSYAASRKWGRISTSTDRDPAGDPKMSTTKSTVHQDEHGVLRVGGTRVMLDSVIAAFHQGHSAETVVQEYPALSLEEVYGAFAYSLGNKHEVDQYLRRQDEVWNQWRERAEAVTSPVVQRVRARSGKAGADVP